MKKTIGIFSGSKIPSNYHDIMMELQKLAKRININKFNIVYGGGDSGLMGIIPKEFHKRGGDVTGFNIQQFVDIDIKNGNDTSIGKQVICEDFDSRQDSIVINSDIILALPGGLGTVYELFQVLVYNDLNLWKDKQKRKVILFDHNNYYSQLKEFVDKGIESKLIKPSTLEHLFFCKDVESVLDTIDF